MTSRSKNTAAQSARAREIRQFLEKIVINAGVGRMSQHPAFESKLLPQVKRDLGLIAGQAPHERFAKKSIAGFKLREGQVVGLRATLRRKRMVDFFERLITIVLPRMKDFRGLTPRAADRSGILSIGFREHLVFPEINPDEAEVIFSLQVNLVPRRKDRQAVLEEYRRFGVPLKKQG